MKHRLMLCTIYIILICLIGFLPKVCAAPGDLDLTFSQDGFAAAALGAGADDDGFATVIQPDGKIVVAGSAKYGWGTKCSITRFNPDGTFDTSFGVDGKVIVPNDYSTYCRAVVIQPDGKLVAAGSIDYFSSIEGGLIVRLNANGSLDSSFDGDGKIITQATRFNSVALQTDGRVVAAGRTGFNHDFALVRYNPTGAPDTSFDGDGMATATAFTANAVTIQADGKIVAAGYSHNGANDDFALLRFNSMGAPDTTFDGDGKAMTDFSGADFATSVAMQTDGKIVAAGYSGSPEFFSFVRYNADGSLDTSFDGDGKAGASILGVSDIAYGMVIQPDGKIVAAGRSGTGSGTNISLVRLNPNGLLDASFDSDGKLTTPVLNFTDYAYGVALQTDGKLVAAGYVRHGTSLNNFNNDLVLVRYNSTGALDTSFDGDGKLSVNLGVRESAAYDVAIQADGKIVAAGYSFNETAHNFTVARYNADGSPDSSFDGDGVATLAVGTGSCFIEALAIQTDGKIVAAGWGYTTNGIDFVLVRYNATGALDTSFDGDGIVTTPFLNADNNDYLNDVAIQPDGKIIAAGRSVYSSSAEAPVFARYNPTGALDTTFDGDGKLTLSVSGFSGANALALQTDGKIVAAGYGIGIGNYDFSLVRLNPDGSFDTSFDGDGRVTTPILNFNDYALGVTIQTDGKIIAAGRAVRSGGSEEGALVRYNPNGSLDSSFDGDGKVTSGFYANFNDLAIQTDGKIVAAAGGLVRYTPTGALDTTYGLGGVTTFTEFGGSSIALDSGGRAVIGGSAAGGIFAVGRVLAEFAPHTAPYDFDGDGKSDISIFRPSTGEWWLSRSSTSTASAAQFGVSSDKIVPGDYTGDGRTDIAVWRESTGEWFILRSEDNSFYSIPFGASGDVPVPADFDGDRKTDIAIYRPSTSVWFINNSSGGTQISSFGAAGDVPVASDYDRDGKTDLAIYRPSVRDWWILRSATSTVTTYRFGSSGDIPVQGDYTGDGRTDSALFRPSTGEWYILRSEDNRTFYAVPFGASGDVPVPGDYDGDGKFDTAVFRPSDVNWFINRSSAGILIQTFGLAGDRPVPNAFVP